VERIHLVSSEARASSEHNHAALSRSFSRHHESVVSAFAELTGEQRRTTSSLQGLQVALERLSLNNQPHLIMPKYATPPEPLGITDQVDGANFMPLRFLTSYKGRCQWGCRCICHRGYLSRSPERLESLLGKLFLGYTGCPKFSSTCNRPDCARQGGIAASVSYFFPTWFTARAVYFTWTYTSAHDPEPCITVPRVRTDEALIFEYAVKGSVNGVKWLLETGRGSPYDVNPRGRSALTVS
jgi:hypothetical protein